MPSLTESIEEYILKLLEERESDFVLLRRKDIAEYFGCVPSQINYVLRSRFTPELGFLVESQRGGHGYIRVTRVCFSDPEEKINHVEELVGDAVSEQEAKHLLGNLQRRGLLSARERLIVEVVLRFLGELSSTLFDLSPYKRDALNAEVLKRVLRGLIVA
ncbi:MAG: CtsR family transcriptional regulator [Synergistales bacterium]|nr:CtsR family transcriptional regulator [Synergistales bacterium]